MYSIYSSIHQSINQLVSVLKYALWSIIYYALFIIHCVLCLLSIDNYVVSFGIYYIYIVDLFVYLSIIIYRCIVSFLFLIYILCLPIASFSSAEHLAKISVPSFGGKPCPKMYDEARTWHRHCRVAGVQRSVLQCSDWTYPWRIQALDRTEQRGAWPKWNRLVLFCTWRPWAF